ncbi:ABC transporter ATP-binding protein [Neptunomonas japonica]|uniref:Antibiotic transport system ATP-binding protein n=1 Tax=Neptunomonas japonica JAMM 1380 TaxID=1441457 RepID=A0A7R6P693_9GAMM|nr:ABC transporter ATP-binding protein [Neptunomonas japonica]BBB28039.1 antibiotic transport system ATP-binding protein [Neptunomonas japonica JAMM 1380]
MSINVEQVSFNYGKKKALNTLNFTLESGQFSALLGPNGAGKSTLFALLTRLYSLQSGSIQLQGLDLQKTPTQVMQQVGVVFQQSTLDLDLSVQQNLAYHAALHGFSSAEANIRIALELERMSMADRANEKVRALNGGHRRRVEIARALLHQPSVLLLDEPTSGLDPQTRKILNQHVRQLCEDQQLTVLWATHLIDEIHSQDRVLLLHQGSLLSSGTGGDLCTLSGKKQLAHAFEYLTQHTVAAA